MKQDESITDALSPGGDSEISECPECFEFSVGGLVETKYNFMGYEGTPRFVCRRCEGILQSRHFERELEKARSEQFSKQFSETPKSPQNESSDFPFVLIPIGFLILLVFIILLFTFR